MAQEPQDRFELFDPLEAIDFENPQDETDYVEFIPPIAKPDEEPPEEKPLPPAPERIAAAIKGMPGEAKLLFHIIEFCREPQDGDAVMAQVTEFRDGAVSIYDPETVCAILEDAGAIEMLYDGDPDAEPTVYEEDGFEYLKVEEAPAFRYVATADGLDAVEADDPALRFEQALDEDERALVPIFRRVLERCEGAGLPKKQIDAFVDSDPLVQDPRRFSGFFIDKLEEAGALRFKDGLWATTPTGKDMLASAGVLSQDEEA